MRVNQLRRLVQSMRFTSYRRAPVGAKGEAMRRVLVSLAVLALVVVAAAVGFVLSFDVNRYKHSLVAMIAEHTGRSFAIDGDIRYNVLPV